MINLLPIQEKNNLLKEEKLKLILILGTVILLALISLSLILFSIKIFISSSVEVQKILVSQKEKDFKNSKLEIFQEKIIETNGKIAKLNNFYQNQLEFTNALEKLSKTLPSGTYLTLISANLQRKEKRGASFNLSGFASDRAVLLKFKENLEKEGSFREINFPPQNWVEPENINFSVSFQIQ